MACTFSTSQFPKVVRSWCVLYMSTTACTFSSSQLPKVVRNLCTFLNFDFEMCFALQRRTLFQYFFIISTSKSRPNLVCFVHFDLEMCFGPQPATLASLLSTLRSHKSLEKHRVSRLSYLFAHLDLLSSEAFSLMIYFLLLFASLTLPIPAFHLSILSEV